MATTTEQSSSVGRSHRRGVSGPVVQCRAVRATLLALGQWIPEGNAEDLAASLPLEVRWSLTGAVREHGQPFDWAEFVSRVAETEGADRADAAYHAQVVGDLVASVVSDSDGQQLRDELLGADDDENWGTLFELVDAGGWEGTRGDS